MLMVEAVPSVSLCDGSQTDLQDPCPNRTDANHSGTEEDSEFERQYIYLGRWMQWLLFLKARELDILNNT